MTSTSVKEVGSMLNNLIPTAAAQNNTGSKVSFQSVWNSQTGKNDQAKDTAPENSGRSTQAAKPGDSLKAKDAGKTTAADTRKAKTEENSGLHVEESEEPDWEEAMEVLGTAAVELLNQIAETFGISVEEVQDMLSRMDMQPVDLLRPDSLSAFLLAVGGAEDSFSLLTNEALYRNFKEIMAELDTMMKTDSPIKGLNLEEVRNLVAQMQANPAGQADDAAAVEEMLPIEVIVEEPVQDKSAKTPVVGEEQNLNVQAAEDQAGVVKAVKPEDAGGTESGRNDSKAQSGNQEQAGNLLLQNLKAEDANFQPVQTQEITSGWNVDTQDIMRQIMDYMKINIKADMSNLEMQLHPENLGSLHIQVASKGGVLTANFVTQNEAVKAALETQMVQLKENFAQQGVKVEAIEVTVQTHQFEQNLEQGQNRQQGEAGRSRRTRRIQLDGSLTMDELDGLGEEEQLAVQMMAANGSTVDYTA